jgi:raffinose/stachyose/melibiose transport system permease protein/N-acetylglucosamine transport system permease protein
MKLNKRRKNILFQKSTSEKIVFGIVFVFFLIWATSLLYPLVWLFTNSLKHNLHYLDSLSKGFALPPSGYWEWENYTQAIAHIEYNDTKFFGMLFNSIWYCLLSLGVNMFLSCCTGYVLSKYEFKIRELIYGLAIVSMTLPVFGTSGATYKFYYVSGIFNTPFYAVFSSLGAFGVRFLMMYGFFKSISWSYAEAVFMDGGNDFIAFFKVMLPMAVGPIVTLSIIASISCWNDYTSIILFMPSYQTVASGLYYVQLTMFEKFPTIYYAALFISMIPVIVVFAIFSEQIMKNMSVGGLKG